MGVTAVCTDGNDSVAFGGNTLESGRVRAIMGANFTVSLDWIEGDLWFCTIELLESWEIRGFTNDFHFVCSFEEIVDQTGQAVVVAETKMSEKEEAHFVLEAIYYWRCMV